MALILKSKNANLNLKADIGQLIKGDDGGYYIPSVDEAGNLTWVASEEEMPEIVGANIRGPQGKDGADGAPGRDGIDGMPGKDGIDGKDGKDGESGVYVGTTEPTDPEALIWINPEGSSSSVATQEYVDNAIANALGSIANAEDGAY